MRKLILIALALAVKAVAAEVQLQSFARTNAAALLNSINAKPELNKEHDAALKQVCEDYFSTASV